MGLARPTIPLKVHALPQRTLWIPFYEELATVLYDYRSRQPFLLEFLDAQRAAGLTVLLRDGV